MQLTLKKPELEQYLDEQVRSGQFPTREAVVEDALMRMMHDASVEIVELTDEDVAAVKLSEQQLDRGEAMSSKDVAAGIRRLHGAAQK